MQKVIGSLHREAGVHISQKISLPWSNENDCNPVSTCLWRDDEVL